MDVNNRILTPFLTGQRRTGLCRVCEIDRHRWEIIEIPDFMETKIGDANEKMRRMGQLYACLSEAVKQVVAMGKVPLSIAGDCISSSGVLAGLQKAGKPPDRIVWLDAHGDFHTWATTQTKYLGGMPLAMLVGRSDRRHEERDAVGAFAKAVGVDPYPEERIILSDARDLDPGEKEAVENSKLVKCRIDEIYRHIVPGESLYLHFDTDVLDAQEEMPALKYQVRGGPTYADMTALFGYLRKQNLIAVSVSAWHEEEDGSNQTASACLKLLEVLGLDEVPI